MNSDGDDENDDRYDDSDSSAFDKNIRVERQELKDEEMRMIEGNDPALTELETGRFTVFGEDNHYTGFDYIVPGGDWEGFGRVVGRNTTLKEVSFANIGGYCDQSSIDLRDTSGFVPGFALNRLGPIKPLLQQCTSLI